MRIADGGERGVVSLVNDFLQVELRDGEAFAAAVGDERRDDREGERQTDDDRSAFAKAGLQLNSSAKPFDVGFDNVHANASAGDVAEGICGGESREEDELAGFLFGEVGGLFGGEETFLNGF